MTATTMATEALGFLLEAGAARAADHPFWSAVHEAEDAAGRRHWLRLERRRLHQGMLPRHWAWLDLQEELGLPPLASEDARWTRCPQRGCVDPRHMIAGPSAAGLPLARPDLAAHDARWAGIGMEADADGVVHWLWQGDRFDAPERWAWSQLAHELGLEQLRPYAGLRRECSRKGCLRPDHLTTRQRMPLPRERRFAALLEDLPPVVVPDQDDGEAAAPDAGPEEPTPSRAAERATRYRTDPDFRAQVQAELRAQARARTEHSRRSQARRARGERTKTKETIDG